MPRTDPQKVRSTVHNLAFDRGGRREAAVEAAVLAGAKAVKDFSKKSLDSDKKVFSQALDMIRSKELKGYEAFENSGASLSLGSASKKPISGVLIPKHWPIEDSRDKIVGYFCKNDTNCYTILMTPNAYRLNVDKSKGRDTLSVEVFELGLNTVQFGYQEFTSLGQKTKKFEETDIPTVKSYLKAVKHFSKHSHEGCLPPVAMIKDKDKGKTQLTVQSLSKGTIVYSSSMNLNNAIQLAETLQRLHSKKFTLGLGELSNPSSSVKVVSGKGAFFSDFSCCERGESYTEFTELDKQIINLERQIQQYKAEGSDSFELKSQLKQKKGALKKDFSKIDMRGFGEILKQIRLVNDELDLLIGESSSPGLLSDDPRKRPSAALTAYLLERIASGHGHFQRGFFADHGCPRMPLALAKEYARIFLEPEQQVVYREGTPEIGFFDALPKERLAPLFSKAS